MAAPAVVSSAYYPWTGAYPLASSNTFDSTGADGVLVFFFSATGTTYVPVCTYKGQTGTLIGSSTVTAQTSAGTLWAWVVRGFTAGSGTLLISSSTNYADTGCAYIVALSGTQSTPLGASQILLSSTPSAVASAVATAGSSLFISFAGDCQAPSLSASGSPTLGTAIVSNTTATNNLGNVYSTSGVSSGATVSITAMAPYNYTSAAVIEVLGTSGGGGGGANAALTQTAGAATIAAGATAAIAAALTRTAGAATLVSASTAAIVANLAATAGAATLASTASHNLNAALSVTAGAATLASGSTAAIAAALTQTAGAATLASASTGAAVANLAQAAGAATLASGSTAAIVANMVQTAGAATLASGATGLSGASLVATAGVATLAASATTAIVANLASTAGAATLVSAAVHGLNAALAVTAGAATLASGSTAAIVANLAQTAGAATLASASSGAAGANLTATAGAAVLAAAATNAVAANLGVTAGAAALASTASVAHTANLAATAGAAVLSASASAAIIANLAAGADAAVLAATATLEVNYLVFPLTLGPGASATFHLQFTPTVAGARTGTLSFVSNAPASSVSLSGTGTGGVVVPGPLLRLSTSGPRIVDSNGATVVLHGVNWHGAEGSNHVPHVLWARSYGSLIDQIAAMGFNLIRIPVSADTNGTTMPAGINTTANPDLVGLTALAVLDKIIAYAGTKGIRVFLDCHRLTYGAGTDSAIAAGSMAAITAFWQMLATRYAANPVVCGADLYNEPYTVAWPTLAGYYATLGNAIHAIAPDWLIICEGTGAFGGVSYWWGGQLAGAASTPVALTRPNKLVYSAHDYAQSVSQQAWLESTSNPSVAGWPGNLDAIWDAAWGYLVKGGTAPIILGEYGGRLGWDANGAVDSTQADAAFEKQWFSHLIGYMHANGISSTFWTFTSESADTGGLLCADDLTPQAGKLALLAPLFA